MWSADLVEYLQRLRRSGLSTDAIARALDKATRSNYPTTSRPLVRPGAVGDVLQIQDALLAADARATRAPRVWETDFGKMKRVVSSDGCDKVKQNPNSTARDAAASDGHCLIKIVLHCSNSIFSPGKSLPWSIVVHDS